MLETNLSFTLTPAELILREIYSFLDGTSNILIELLSLFKSYINYPKWEELQNRTRIMDNSLV